MSESNQRSNNDYNYSSQDDPDDLDREHAQNVGRDKGRNAADDMNRRGMMIDSDVRHQAGTDLHDGSQYDQQDGSAYESRMGSGDDMQEGARGGSNQNGDDMREAGRTPRINSREPMDADRNASDNVSYTGNNFSGSDIPGQYQSSTAGYGMTDRSSRGSGTGETDARYMHQTSNQNSPNNVGDEGFSDTMTPATGGPGSGAIRTDWQGDYSRADTEETQSDHFRDELNKQGEAGVNTDAQTQAEHFQEERRAQGEGDYHTVAQSGATAGQQSDKR